MPLGFLLSFVSSSIDFLNNVFSFQYYKKLLQKNSQKSQKYKYLTSRALLGYLEEILEGCAQTKIDYIPNVFNTEHLYLAISRNTIYFSIQHGDKSSLAKRKTSTEEYIKSLSSTSQDDGQIFEGKTICILFFLQHNFYENQLHVHI